MRTRIGTAALLAAALAGTAAGQTPAVVDLTPDTLPGPVVTSEPSTVSPSTAEAGREEGGVYGVAELLIWRPRSRNLDFGIADPSNNNTPEGSISSLKWDTRAGLRGSLGYRSEGGLDGRFTYTYFHSGDSAFLGASPGGLVYATGTRPGTVDEATIAEANSALNFNLYDADLGKYLHFNECLALRLAGGVRFAQITEDFKATYDGRDATRALLTRANDFSGAGPLVGAEGLYQVGYGFALTGKARAALVYGNSQARHRETNVNGTVVNADVVDDVSQAVPVLDLGLGVAWRYRGFWLGAGYEITNWFDLFNEPSFVDDFSAGRVGHQTTNLSLDGVYFQAGVNY